MAKYEDLVAEDDWLLAFNGRAWRLGDDIRLADILPPEQISTPAEQAAKHLFRNGNPHFADLVQEGDVIVAGGEFGGDVAQKEIVAILRAAGVGALIARSFGHFFLKNCINAGLPALIIEESPAMQTGDRLRVDIEAHVVANKSSGDRYVVRNLSEHEIAVLRAGGLIEYTKRTARKP